MEKKGRVFAAIMLCVMGRLGRLASVRKTPLFDSGKTLCN